MKLRHTLILSLFTFITGVALSATLPAVGQTTRHLKISKNGRYLEKNDGSTFVWLGDTAWELFHRLSREEADLYLKNRAEKGFTLIQAVVLAELDGLRDAELLR